MSHREKVLKLEKIISNQKSEAYPMHSRVHPLNSQPFEEASLFVKREDELGVFSMGSKIRKYRTLIEDLKERRVSKVVLVGGENSNHIAFFSLLLKENRIEPFVFLRKTYEKELRGTRLLTHLLNTNIFLVERKDWGKVEDIAKAKQVEIESQGFKAEFLREGGFSKAGLIGALTLVLDLLKNENEIGLAFQHIFLDSGTGFQAAAFLLGLNFIDHRAKCHVLLVGGDTLEFEKNLTFLKTVFESLVQDKLSFNDRNFELYQPSVGKSFGSTPKIILKQALQTLLEEGLVLDPFYSAKLFFEANKIISEKNLKGNILYIHSGGSLSLLNYGKELMELKSQNSGPRNRQDPEL